MADVKRTVLVTSDHLTSFARILTGYGRIVGMDHEGTITYELEGEDEFELGRMATEVQNELRSYDTGAQVVSVKKR